MKDKNPLNGPHAGLNKMGGGPGAKKIIKSSLYGTFDKPFNCNKDYYVETKVVTRDLSSCRDICNQLVLQGMDWDGIIQNDGIAYWSFVKKNNNLVEDGTE